MSSIQISATKKKCWGCRPLVYGVTALVGILLTAALQVKYFKEKRVMEYNRDRTIERIKKEDAQKVQELKSQGWKPN